ncbi:MAG: NACHT domain-containing protein [Anaerolineales bacterium]|nr:NACHT domain-containing protein [Anaerolineales bacterium]
MPPNKPDSQNTEPPKVEAKDNSIAVGSIEVHGNVEGGIHIGNTIIQKFFNIFKSDSETLEHRNRRILLGHVENAWIKGVLDASLHGAALLDLGIKQDPEAVTKYPWVIKKESTNETLPAGTSMLEIFDSIGMGRSLLILGAPGSGKTTMLLELARQLIARAREDVTQPIPMVFNLASWTEKLTLADWLAQELNNLYSVPRKTAPDWVKENKLLLLLDGLDEVRQESRVKCVEAINAFRKEHGLTSLAVCSRSQDYADLNAKLSFEGAIEVQPLTQKQITEFFNRFGKEMAGIKQVLKKGQCSARNGGDAFVLEYYDTSVQE